MMRAEFKAAAQGDTKEKALAEVAKRESVSHGTIWARRSEFVAHWRDPSDDVRWIKRFAKKNRLMGEAWVVDHALVATPSVQKRHKQRRELLAALDALFDSLGWKFALLDCLSTDKKSVVIEIGFELCDPRSGYSKRLLLVAMHRLLHDEIELVNRMVFRLIEETTPGEFSQVLDEYPAKHRAAVLQCVWEESPAELLNAYRVSPFAIDALPAKARREFRMRVNR
jgi:hypothetical protein